MSQAVSMDEIIDATLNGILEAQQLYADWSAGEWLWNAPEYFLTVKIAENIAKIEKSKFITLEDKVANILTSANAKGRGKISERMRITGRFDIIIWWADRTPRAIVEVKNQVDTYNKIEQDIIRIIEIIKRKYVDSSLQFGAIAFYMSKTYSKGNAVNKLQNQINNIFESAKKNALERGVKIEINQSSIMCNDNENAYCAVVFKLRI